MITTNICLKWVILYYVKVSNYSYHWLLRSRCAKMAIFGGKSTVRLACVNYVNVVHKRVGHTSESDTPVQPTNFTTLCQPKHALKRLEKRAARFLHFRPFKGAKFQAPDMLRGYIMFQTRASITDSADVSHVSKFEQTTTNSPKLKNKPLYNGF